MASPVSLGMTSTRWWLTPTDVGRDCSDIRHPALRAVELTGDVENGLDDLLVAGAPAEVAFDAFLDLLDRRLRVALQQVAHRHDHAAGAEPALDGVVPREGELDRGQLLVVGLTLDGLHVATVGLGCERQARVDDLAVEEDGARTALPHRAPFLGAREPQAFAQEPQQ